MEKPSKGLKGSKGSQAEIFQLYGDFGLILSNFRIYWINFWLDLNLNLGKESSSKDEKLKCGIVGDMLEDFSGRLDKNLSFSQAYCQFAPGHEILQSKLVLVKTLEVKPIYGLNLLNSEIWKHKHNNEYKAPDLKDQENIRRGLSL